MAAPLCTCRCHDTRITSGRPVAPEAAPHVEAVLACARCVNAHCGVLLEREVWAPKTAPAPQPAAVEQCDGEGAEA